MQTDHVGISHKTAKNRFKLLLIDGSITELNSCHVEST